MNTSTKIQLDWKKLIGFKLAADSKAQGLTPANLAKAGSKGAGIKGN